MRPFIFLVLPVLFACGVKRSSIEYGKTSVAALIQAKGQPAKQEAIPVKDSKVLHYSPDEKYQSKGDIITNAFKGPKGDQKSLIYWKHKFKDCDTKVIKLGPETKGHELPEYEMSCDEQGMSVIFVEGSEFISRIVEYEKK